MPIRYKVVKRKTRMSAIINGHSIYALRYLKDTNVFARQETLGVMTFKTRDTALNWASAMEDENLIVIMVETIGKGKIPKQISAGVGTDRLREFYNDPHCESGFAPVDDTVCYPGVRVLE